MAKERYPVVNVVLINYIAASFFYFWRIESFAKDIVVAPLFFLVPTGFGLFLLSLSGIYRKLQKNIAVLQIVLASTLLGFLSISLIYTEMNNRDMLMGGHRSLYPLICLLSLSGFYLVRDSLGGGKGFLLFLKTAAVSVPLFLIVYYFLFLHFSPFPLRDIFMETHFMKGALEFSRYGILNIATGDTYFALLQVHLGLLNHYFGYNLINSQWILPFYLFWFAFICFYCFYSAFLRDQFILTTALALNTIFMSLMFSNSNNTYLIMLAVVFFAILVTKNHGRTRAAPLFMELLLLIFLSVFFYMNRKIPPFNETLLPYLSAYLLIMFLISYMRFDSVLPILFVILLELIAPQFHRAASLYIPLMLILYWVYFFSFQWEKVSDISFKKMIFGKMTGYGLALPFLGIGLGVVVALIWPLSSEYISDFVNPISLAIVGQRVSENQGIVGNTAELVRFVPPSVWFLSLLLSITMYKKRNLSKCIGFMGKNIDYMIFSLGSLAILLFFYFTPLPNIHRLLVFPVLMIFLVTALLLKFYYEQYFKDSRSSNSAIFVPVSIILYTLSAIILYRLPWKYPTITSPYVAELFPITELLILWIFIALIAFISLRYRKSLAWFFLFSIFMSSFMVDHLKMVTKLYGNSYGYVLPENKTISHYTSLELTTAESLGRHIKSPSMLLFSDPYTLGIFESRTGINGFYTFSNLGLMLDTYKKNIKSIMRSVFPSMDAGEVQAGQGTFVLGDYRTRNMNVLGAMNRYLSENRGSYPEAEYALQSRLRLHFLPQGFDSVKSWSQDYRERIYWILTEKTIRWAYGDVGYYPMNGRFTKSYIDNYILPYFNIILNSDDRVFVLKLK